MTKFLAVLLVLLLLIPLVACRRVPLPDCLSILRKLTDCETGLPAGRVYALNAAEGEEEYISQTLLSALYSAPLTVQSGWVDGAFFLPSHDAPCELAVILCDSPSAVEDTARLLSARLASVRELKENDENRGYFENATVSVLGNYVCLLISSDSRAALTLLKRACR